MKRWHEEFHISYREWKKHHRSHIESNIRNNREVGRDPWKVDCVCDTQIGRFRKKDAWDCGNTRCYICHSVKFPKREMTFQEQRSKLKMKEGIEDLHDL